MVWGRAFVPQVQTISVEAGVGLGMATFGGTQAHDLALTSLSYGHMWGPVLGKDHWYRGNFEYRIELLGGAQSLSVQRLASGTYASFALQFCDRDTLDSVF